MTEPSAVLVVAHQTAATTPLLQAVSERATRGATRFHLVVPQRARGLHRLLDPEDSGREEAERVLAQALPELSRAAGGQVTGSVGVAEPLMAIEDAVHRDGYDEIIISTLPLGVSRWLKLDLVSKARALGPPVTHVVAGVPTSDPVAV